MMRDFKRLIMIIVIIQVLKWDVRSKVIINLNVSLLSLKQMYT